MNTKCTAHETAKILAFEAWDAGSHRAVREAIERHASSQWHWRTLPRGNWRWRLRLGAADLVREASEVGVFERPWDAVFATSMLSLTDLCALMPSQTAGLPRVLYMHENQAAYPASEGRRDPRDAHAAATNLTSMLAADIILWNSRWNQESFCEVMEELLRHAGDRRSVAAIEDVRARSRTAWPPVERPRSTDRRVLHNTTLAKARGLTLVAWPHRWEHDKGPRELLQLERTHGAADRIGWVLLGEQFQQRPPEFEALRASAGDRVIHAGTAPRDAYETWLCECDWVLSTAIHEFFGIAVVEALLAGCLPWLPARLSYPELLPDGCLGFSPAQPPADINAARKQIQSHLRSAEAPAAVRHIEAAVCEAIAGYPEPAAQPQRRRRPWRAPVAADNDSYVKFRHPGGVVPRSSPA